MGYNRYDDGVTPKKIVKYGVLSIVGIVIVIALIVGGSYGICGLSRAYQRHQDVLDAENQVRVNAIVIQQTQQLVEVENQKAEVRKAEARGIAAAQTIINASLTPLYLQHEAIQAQQAMAGAPNHSVVYIPTGDNGIPLVGTVNAANPTGDIGG